MTDPTITPPTPTPPAGAPSADPTPGTSGSPTPPADGTPPASSAGADPAPADPNAAPEPKPEPTPEEAAAAARAAVHETPDGYQVNLDDGAREALGLADGDPLVAGLTDYAAKNGKPQGWVDDALEAGAVLAKAGLFDSGFDPAAEAAKLGDNAAGRRREVEVFAEALKARGDGFDEDMFGELMSLSPTAAGIRTVEYLRKMMSNNGQLPNPGGQQQDPADAAKEEAKTLAADPRYGKDRRFTREADEKWAAAFGGRL